MIRKKKLYVRPKKLYEKSRIDEENLLVKKYGLKNKREIWKASAKINYYRSRAKDLAKLSLDEQKVLFNKLTGLGIRVDSIADVLALQIENLLERRLPSVIARKGLAKTPQQARQMVVHKNVVIDGKVVNTPSYIVPVAEEDKITIKLKQKKHKATASAEQKAESVPAKAEPAEAK